MTETTRAAMNVLKWRLQALSPKGLPDYIFRPSERKGLPISKVREWAGRMETALTENRDYRTPMATSKKEIQGRFNKLGHFMQKVVSKSVLTYFDFLLPV